MWYLDDESAIAVCCLTQALLHPSRYTTVLSWGGTIISFPKGGVGVKMYCSTPFGVAKLAALLFAGFLKPCYIQSNSQGRCFVRHGTGQGPKLLTAGAGEGYGTWISDLRSPFAVFSKSCYIQIGIRRSLPFWEEGYHIISRGGWIGAKMYNCKGASHCATFSPAWKHRRKQKKPQTFVPGTKRIQIHA